MKTKSVIYYALISSIFLFSLVSIWKILVTLQGVEIKNFNFAIIIILGIAISLLNLLIGEKLNYLIKSTFKLISCPTKLSKLESLPSSKVISALLKLLNEIDKKLPDVAIIDVKLDKGDNDGIEPVSYTHLTLPTKRIV